MRPSSQCAGGAPMTKGTHHLESAHTPCCSLGRTSALQDGCVALEEVPSQGCTRVVHQEFPMRYTGHSLDRGDGCSEAVAYLRRELQGNSASDRLNFLGTPAGCRRHDLHLPCITTAVKGQDCRSCTIGRRGHRRPACSRVQGTTASEHTVASCTGKERPPKCTCSASIDAWRIT